MRNLLAWSAQCVLAAYNAAWSARFPSLFLLIALLACDRGRGAEDVTQKLVLLGTQQSATDTLEIHLVNRLRELLEAATSGDSTAIASLITSDFTAIDMRVAESNNSLVAPTWGEALSYWQALGGRLSERLTHEYRAFDASIDGNSATVVASGKSHDLWSAWSYRNASWQVASLVIVPTASTRPSISRNSPMRRRR
jgi:hypothetical protein